MAFLEAVANGNFVVSLTKDGALGAVSWPYPGCMSLSEVEFFEAGMCLPPHVRKHVALRLLESVDSDGAFDLASESWLRTEAAAAFEALKSDPSRAVPSGDVRERLESKWAARP